MAPAVFPNLIPRDTSNAGHISTSKAFREEWTHPSNYAFTILLLVGGDIVLSAIAALAGGRIVPVVFSFGMLNVVSRSIARVYQSNAEL